MIPVEKNPFVRGWFEGRRVLILGLGKSGVAAAGLLSRLGARVSVTEKRSKAACLPWVRELPTGTDGEFGTHHFIERSWDLVVASPGVPSSVWSSARKRGIPVWGELELGFRILSLAKRWPAWSAAITGTNGKTTTTALLGAIFRATGRQTVVAGNIGVPLCAVVNHIVPSTALVLEVSSYQLETTEAFRPSVAAVLNVTPDHLERHQTMAAYAATKFRIFQSQQRGDSAILNRKDLWCRRFAPLARGKIHWFGDQLRGRWKEPRFLPGRHNVSNALAAVACAHAFGVRKGAIAQALATFRGVEHRLELAHTRRGVRFINDSKATNVDSTRVALDAFPKPLFVILGGQDKGAPYTPLGPLLKKKAKSVFLIGEASEKIERDLLGQVPLVRCETLARAVDRAARAALEGDVVLFSPACASFDQFENYEHRGREFKRLVRGI